MSPLTQGLNYRSACDVCSISTCTHAHTLTHAHTQFLTGPFLTGYIIEQNSVNNIVDHLHRDGDTIGLYFILSLIDVNKAACRRHTDVNNVYICMPT